MPPLPETAETPATAEADAAPETTVQIQVRERDWERLAETREGRRVLTTLPGELELEWPALSQAAEGDALVFAELERPHIESVLGYLGAQGVWHRTVEDGRVATWPAATPPKRPRKPRGPGAAGQGPADPADPRPLRISVTALAFHSHTEALLALTGSPLRERWESVGGKRFAIVLGPGEERAEILRNVADRKINATVTAVTTEVAT